MMKDYKLTTVGPLYKLVPTCGNIPKELSGLYTSEQAADAAVDAYVQRQSRALVKAKGRPVRQHDKDE